MILESDITAIRYAAKDLDNALKTTELKSVVTCIINDLDRLADKMEIRMLRELVTASRGTETDKNGTKE